MYLIFLGVATSLFTNLKFSTILLAIIYVTILSMLTNLGMLGIGFIFASGSLSFKRIGQWSTLLQAAIILFSNVGIPLTTPLQLIVPFSGGIEIVRSLILNKPISVNELIITLIVNILWFIAGIVVLNVSVKNERKNGSFTAF
ncbi:hypothetical protein [Bombilactobacillus thymidiniphilus]|uniref:ABC-2 type transporter domain-containing protein n=1 Tax=Bombilactobacillus thymidiniphilus TaxID=2923363 RepID=A0ABY4PDL1_9LACO|nr:hypothetical protein [Bombilactobacillus thymidiniphilus]UQS83610.1 hypothetical protein MOO47_07555 [Bombilactobacillus thymidiniphilus]UQS83617.1 hypothetical protein MOO47_07590 [Bombilactobacillus thymidiniphilus]UQS83630.1 hypothetical protein MOO47_00040 [Bombilactobacillus thymidiniphilus]UQS83637.1 hypothetical protein MOO47_00075 [Bombilactobacillus thymidiniphilus]